MKKFLLTLLLSSLTLFASPALGSKAPAFKLPLLSNSSKVVTMDTYKNRVVLLNLWASWCKGCRAEMPLLHNVGSKFSGKKFKVVAVNLDNDSKKAQKFVKKLKRKLGTKPKITFLSDTNKSVAKAYSADAIPMSILIKNGKIVKYYVGSFKSKADEKELISQIKKALKR